LNVLEVSRNKVKSSFQSSFISSSSTTASTSLALLYKSYKVVLDLYYEPYFKAFTAIKSKDCSLTNKLEWVKLDAIILSSTLTTLVRRGDDQLLIARARFNIVIIAGSVNVSRLPIILKSHEKKVSAD
jgi:hypothetical protein